MITIRFNEIVQNIAEKKICIYLYNPYRSYPKNYINDSSLFKLIVDTYGDYYVDQLDVDSCVLSLVLVKPDDLEMYIKDIRNSSDEE